MARGRGRLVSGDVTARIGDYVMTDLPDIRPRLELIALAAWVNVANPDALPKAMLAPTCRHTMTAWKRVADAIAKDLNLQTGALIKERDDLRRLVRLLDEQRAASGWGAAVGQREEEIAGLRRNLGLN